MKYRNLGDTGLGVSEIGFGAWGIGGVVNGTPSYGPTDDRESESALRRAFDLGVNFYDTAAFYGYGHSEELIGKVFEDVRHQVIIATKVGLLDAQGSQDFSPDHIRSSLEESLRHLHSDYVDLYQLHSPPIDLLVEDGTIKSTMQSLQREGKIRAIGISVRSPDDAIVAINKFGLQCVQLNFNLLDQRPLENGLFDLCGEKGVGVIVRTPLCFGFLTGGYSPESEFESTDHRSNWSRAQLKTWANAHKLFVDPMGRDAGQTQAQFSLRFCLSHPSVSTVIPGMLRATEVEENATASDLGVLTEQQLIEVSKVYRDNSFLVER